VTDFTSNVCKRSEHDTQRRGVKMVFTENTSTKYDKLTCRCQDHVNAGKSSR